MRAAAVAPAVVVGLLLSPLFPACSACPPEARALVERPDYSTPESAGRSFFAALSCDDAEREYRALGESLKRRYGATFDVYLLGRERLREELGDFVLRNAHRLRPVRREVREDGVVVGYAAGGAERVALLFHRQDYLELRTADGRRIGLPLPAPPGAFLRLEGKDLALELRARDPVFRGLDPDEVVAVVLAGEWKLADVASDGAGDANAPEAAPER